MAVDWPITTAPAYGMSEEYYKPQVKDEFENGAVQSRARTTKGKRRWPNLTWPALPHAEWETLKVFFEANQGGTFIWGHPVTAEEIAVRFSSDKLKGDHAGPGIVRVQLGLEEA